MKLTYSQDVAIDTIYDYYVDIKNKQNEDKTVYFKAPTGAGKTFIASKLISRILKRESLQNDTKTIFMVATVSNAELPKQFAEKVNSK